MKKLGLRDVFAFSEILDVMNIKLEIPKIIQESEGNETAVGFEVAMTIFKNMYKAQDQIINWLANLTDKTVEEVEELGFLEIKDILVEIFTSKDIVDFFKSLFTTEQ